MIEEQMYFHRNILVRLVVIVLKMVVVVIFMVGRDGSIDRSDSSIARSSSLTDRSRDLDACDGVVVGDKVGNDWTGLKVMLEMTVVV